MNSSRPCLAMLQLYQHKKNAVQTLLYYNLCIQLKAKRATMNEKQRAIGFYLPIFSVVCRSICLSVCFYVLSSFVRFDGMFFLSIVFLFYSIIKSYFSFVIKQNRINVDGLAAAVVVWTLHKQTCNHHLIARHLASEPSPIIVIVVYFCAYGLLLVPLLQLSTCYNIRV